METQAQYSEYLQIVNAFLDMDLADCKTVVQTVQNTEPDNRVNYIADKDSFSLGMVEWPAPRVLDALKSIQTAIQTCLDSAVDNGLVNEAAVDALCHVRHDLKIQYIYSADSSSGLKLSYIVPDSKIAWDEGKCPHCSETVTIHLFPDPIPIMAYEAIINALRLLSRSVPLKRENGNYALR